VVDPPQLIHTRPVDFDSAVTLQALLDVLPQPVLFADPRGRVTFGNPAACALLGYPLLELRTLLHVSDVYQRTEDPRRVLRALKDGGGHTLQPVDVLLRTRSGEIIPARVHARLLRSPDGTLGGTLGVLEDQREIVDLSKRLEDASSQVVASEKRAAVVALAAKAAHDLSQPLMAAMGNIELILMQPELDPAVVTRLDRAYEQLERLRGIVADFVRMTGNRSFT